MTDTTTAGRGERTLFRDMMSRFPTGVAVVTCTGENGEPRGMTCSSVCSVTLTPPTLLICLRSASKTLAALSLSGRFTVNLLHEYGQHAAELFASGDTDRFDRVPWVAGTGGPHLPAHSHSVADCVVAGSHPVGDHIVVVGEVTAISRHGEDAPLLYGLRSYRVWT